MRLFDTKTYLCPSTLSRPLVKRKLLLSFSLTTKATKLRDTYFSLKLVTLSDLSRRAATHSLIRMFFAGFPQDFRASWRR